MSKDTLERFLNLFVAREKRGSARLELNDLLNQAKAEAKLQGMEDVNTCHSCVDNDEELSEERARLKLLISKEEVAMHNQMENKRGEWVPSIPLPFYGLRKVCGCGEKFWREKSYQAHYALEHIVLGEKPL